jgi:hypothetical protein
MTWPGSRGGTAGTTTVDGEPRRKAKTPEELWAELEEGDIIPLGGVGGLLEPPFMLGRHVCATRADLLELLLGPEVAAIVIPHLTVTRRDAG